MKARVLHVSAVDFTTSKLLAPQLDHLRELGYDVRVATGRTDDAHWQSISRFRPFDLPFPRSLNAPQMLTATIRLRRLVASWRPDVLHLHTPAASLPVRLLPRSAWPRRMRVVYTVHGYLHLWPPVGRRDRLIQRFEQWESRRTDVSLFQSQEDFANATVRGYRGQLVHLGNGVQDDWFDLGSIPDREHGDLELLFVGRLVKEKGILDLLDAVARVPGISLHVAGDALPSDRDSVRDEVVARSEDPELVNRIHLHGMLDRTELMQLYARVHALCLPSYREGVPRSVIEALAAGRPVIATEIRGSRELVSDGHNGFLSSAGDTAALVASLERLRDLPQEGIQAMSERARRSVDPEHRETRVFDRIHQTYRSLGIDPIAE